MNLTPEQITERLAHFGPLEVGSHSVNSKACVMEAVAFVAGEAWSDHPECSCPVISAFLRAWNDALPDDERDSLLRPLIPRLIGTRGTASLERRRSLMAADWLVRTHTPAWLRLAGLTTHADALSGLPEITDMAQIPSLRGSIEAAQRDADAARVAAWDAAGAAAWAAAGAAAGAAARDAAGAAAGDAAWDAARDAARVAAWDAAGAVAWAAARAAARDAAGTVAWAAARAAAWDAARDAAGAALRDTRKTLQQSALNLVERMISAT
jgi:hypothetical protein